MRTSLHAIETDRLALTSAELAKHLGISQRHLHTLNRMEKGTTPIRLGHSVRWARSEIERWLEAGGPDQTAWEATKRA